MYKIDKVRELPKLVCVYIGGILFTLGKYQFLLQFLVFFFRVCSSMVFACDRHLKERLLDLLFVVTEVHT